MKPEFSPTIALPRIVIASSVLVLLSACGGSSNNNASNLVSSQQGAEIASTTLVLDLSQTGQAAPAVSTEVAAIRTLPTYHLAPVVLNEPSNIDAFNPSTSAAMGPAVQQLPVYEQGVPTQRLTLDSIRGLRFGNAAAGASLNLDPDAVKPAASGTAVATYTPAQIRAAYGLPALPASFTGLSAAQAAQLGAGQTIYLVDAYHDPNVAAELAAFNQKFGLPGCTTKTLASTATLPLAAASASSCDFYQVYSNSSGKMNSTAPAYDAGWATEITLDVQWAHATAPLARIVLIEAPDSSIGGLGGGITLANAMGPGVVSMSFGAAEGSWTASVDSYFAGTNMTYLAATGDNGAAVSWPSVSAKVLGVGGTSLTYSGSSRSEAAWSGTGGGVSAYVATPAYQTSAVPGMGTPVRRTVADVAFNADPSTGQYVAVINPGSSTVSWVSAGGTSLSTPQWAGLIAVANAMRAQGGKAVIGQPHSLLYQQVAAVSAASYAANFADINKGSDGSCATCTAKTGYDFLTGLGTPNASALLSTLSGATISTPPVVTGATINGQVGTALSFTVAVSSANPVSYSLTGNPSGMSISTAGVVSWAVPVAGSYSVTVTATDSKSGLKGSAVYTVVVAAPVPPTVSPATINGKVGTALSFTAIVSAPNPVSYALSGAPSGMSISSAGVVSWAAPVAGSYAVTVKATDSKTGLSGSAVYTVVIAANGTPVIQAANVSGKVGTPLSYSVLVSGNINPLSYALINAPSGMSISTAGVISWAVPVAGSYSVTVKATDSKTGLSGQAVLTIGIAAASSTSGPVITASGLSGVAGKALSGQIVITDPGVTGLSISISGIPLGMSFSTTNGTTLNVNWPSPVAGSYNLVVNVVDSAGRSASATLPVTISK